MVGGLDGKIAPEQPLADGLSLLIVALGAYQPFAAFLMANAAQLVHLTPVIVASMCWVAFNLIAFVGARTATRARSPFVVAVAFATFNIAFWNFGRLFPWEPTSGLLRWVALAVWFSLAALLILLAMKLAQLPKARLFVAVLLSFWVLGSLANFALARSQASGGDQPDAYAGPDFVFEEKPNVYWFMLDEHARSDELEKFTGADNSWFNEELSDRGFSTSDSSRSAYLQTHLSVTSTLSMGYPFTPGHDYRGEYQMAADLLAHNAVVDTFKDNGYTFVFAPDASVDWAGCPDEHDAFVCVEPEGGPVALAEPLAPLVRSTPIGSFDWPVRYSDPDSALAGIEAVRDEYEPMFFFTHILSPHTPFRYNADCSRRAHPVEGFSYSGEERAHAYGVDVQCLDREMVETIDALIEDDPTAVIIVQSDHGSRLGFGWNTTYDEVTPAILNERASVLNAIRLPASCENRSIEGESLVNTYRIVFACLSRTAPDLLPQRTFFTVFNDITTLVEVPEDAFDEQ